ncbi:hypothetical protein DRN84_02895 [Candidatus Geothermarchaeota archaeon]|nr:MAG: hypothetical protein DRN84_02895 [Candidatus Geothermarchaeota archaeon]
MGYIATIFGTGAQARVLTWFLEHDKEVDEFRVAGRNMKKVEAIVKKYEKAVPYKADATKVDQIVEASKGADILINAVVPEYNTNVLKAAYEAKSHYIDMAFGPPYDNLEKELEYSNKFKDIDRVAITSTGLTPGTTNILAALAADELDEIDRIKIYDVDIADSDIAFSTWSPETFIADCLEKDTYVYDNGLKRVPPFSGYEEIEVPIFGRQPFWYHAHEEQVTLWRFIGKKVNKVEFKIGGPATEFVYNLYLNGLLSRDSIEYDGCKITPLDFYLKIVPRPPTEEELRKWIDEGLLRDAKEVAVTEVWGWRDEDYYHYKYTVIGPSIKDIIKKVPPANHSSYLVSGGCYLLVRMIADGMIRERGVIVPEQINRDARIRYVKDHSRVLDPSIEIRLEIEATLSK